MPGARWFPGAAINYAEHALSMPGREPADVVVIGRSQTRDPVDLTADELRDARRALPGGPAATRRRAGATAWPRSSPTSRRP